MKRYSESFDFDLLKLVPQAEEILRPIAEIELVTVGYLSDAHEFAGASVWNGDRGFIAVFGFADSPSFQWKPEAYEPGYPLVYCTALEMFCDAWAKGYTAYVNRAKIWSGYKYSGALQRLMYQARGYAPLSNQVAEELRNTIANSLKRAVLSLEIRQEQYEYFKGIRQNSNRVGGGLSEMAMLHT